MRPLPATGTGSNRKQRCLTQFLVRPRSKGSAFSTRRGRKLVNNRLRGARAFAETEHQTYAGQSPRAPPALQPPA